MTSSTTAAAADSEDLFAPEVIADPYAYFGRLREKDPIHWNPRAEMWIVTRFEDLVWLVRHHELFSSAVIKTDQRPPHPPIDPEDGTPLRAGAGVPVGPARGERPARAPVDAKRGPRVLHAAGDGELAPLRPRGRQRAPGRGRAARANGRSRSPRRTAPRACDHADDGRPRRGPRAPAAPRRQAPLHQPRRAGPDAPPAGGDRRDDRLCLAEGRRAGRRSRAPTSSRCSPRPRRKASSPAIRCSSTRRCSSSPATRRR